MKIPLTWLENYIKLDHTPEKFGDIMTLLQFMQDGPIEEINGQQVIDLETRQNRPDSYSIIGLAREYAAYLNKKITLPPEIEGLELEWEKPDKNLSVQAKDIVKRFVTVEIKNTKIKRSPKWLKNSLEAYGMPSVNALVDITNYVMIEYGMPMHAFDIKKLDKSKDHPLLTLRRADTAESFVTWQGTQLHLSSEDLVVADAKRPVAVAGVIGGANSDIDAKTNHIILEAATYEHAYIRRTSLRHSIRTDASTRHEKFLNPEMATTAINRALHLIQDICKGEIVKIEDYYEKKQEPISIDLNIYEITRLSGVQLETDEVQSLLERLGFDVVEQKEAIGIGKNLLVVRVPIWRTDINIEADLVEEVMRLWGYNNIPFQEISTAPPDYGTSVSLQLEDKIVDILLQLGLNEHITNPLITFADLDKQILLENPLNKEMNALRTTIRETLQPAIIRHQKSGATQSAMFEVGKVYFELKKGKYSEEKRIETMYQGHHFRKVKGDLVTILSQLGLSNKLLTSKLRDDKLIYEYENTKIAELYEDGYVLITDSIVPLVDIHYIPHYKIQTQLVQKITEELSLVMKRGQRLGEVVEIIQNSRPNITTVEVQDIYDGNQIKKNQKSVTFKVVFEDITNSMTQEMVEEIKKEILNELGKLGIKQRG